MAKVLITGGCGYIGSHTLIDLIENGFDPFSIDSLVNSDTSPLRGIRKITGRAVKNYPTDLCDLRKTRAIFEKNPDISGVIHFAALKSVPESVAKPLLYFRNNLDSLLNLLACMTEFGVKNLIFSSSCSVYGNARELPVTENTPFEEAMILKDGKLEVTSTPNQDNPLMDVAETKGTPLFGIDVWEHAYYLKYQNKRPDYLKAIWNVVNWGKVGERYSAAK